MMKKSLVLVSLLFLALLSIVGTDVFADEYDKTANEHWKRMEETGESVKNTGPVGRAIDAIVDKVTDDTRQMSSSNSNNSNSNSDRKK